MNDAAIVTMIGGSIDVLANDTDVDGDTLSVTDVGAATHGTVSFSPGGVFYVPNQGYSGSDSFTYTISDGNGGTDTATVSVTVPEPPPPPPPPPPPIPRGSGNGGGLGFAFAPPEWNWSAGYLPVSGLASLDLDDDGYAT